jgi:exopolysaccharide production protein ExoQ
MAFIIYIACIIYLILPTQALSFADRMIYGEWSGKSGDKLTQALNVLAIVVSLVLFWWGAQRRRRPGFNRALPLVAVGLLLTSVLWSVAPSTTITRGVAYFFLVVGAIGIVEILEPHQVMRVIALIGGFSAAISLILPQSTDAITGDFRGLFPGKNQLGQAMVIGVLGGLHGIRVRGWRGFLDIGVIMLCTTVAFLTKSATSLLTIVAFFILHIIGTFYAKGSGFRIISMFVLIAVTAISVMLMTNIDSIYSILGKDPTLSGRTDFWPYVIDYIYQRPLLGWGFAAFWMLSNPPAIEIFSTIGFGINEAHNGILQLLLDVGVLGTAFFLFLWIRNFVMAVRCMNGSAPEIGVSSLLFLVGILLIGVSEQVLTTADEVTAGFFLLGFMCERELGLARQARSAVVLRSAALRFGQFASPTGEDAV